MSKDNIDRSTMANRLTFSFDLRIITLVLLAVIAAMLLMWRPWTRSAPASDRTVQVTGQATITAEPDEYVFYPSYSFKNTDKDAALAELSKKSDAIVAKLKTLGVADSKIKTNSSDYGKMMYYPSPASDGTSTYTLQLTVTVANKDLAQKVQDYLVSTTPSGTVSPQASFSDAKRKELESKARDEATKDARAKADQSAKNLGFKVGGVKTVNDGSGFGIYDTMSAGGKATLEAMPARDSTSLSVQPGENDLNYSVTVTYYVK